MAISRQSRLYAALRGARSRAIRGAMRLSSVHATAYVHQSSHVATDLVAEEYVFIGRDCTVAPGVLIGRYTMFASEVAVVGDDHNWDQPGVPMQFSGRPAQRPTRVGADVWIGHGVVVMRGITIGDGTIVAAGAVVTADVPAYEVWAGVPARHVRDRFDDPADVATHAQMLNGPVLAPTFAGHRELQRCSPHLKEVDQ